MNTELINNAKLIFKDMVDVWHYATETKYLVKCYDRADYFKVSRAGEPYAMHRAQRAKIWERWERALEIASDNMGA